MESVSDNAVEYCLKYAREGLRPPPDLTVDEWADQNRELSSKASGEPGPWRTSRVPYAREIMEELSPSSHAEDIVFQKGTQIAATEMGINMILYIMDHTPGPTLAVYPTIDMAKKYSRQRLQPSISTCKNLRGKVKDNRSRDSGNTTLMKEFPGGTLVMTGANSAAGLRMMPMRFGHFDEIDAYPEDVDGEGDPLDLAIKRFANFKRRKRFYSSSPTKAGRSRIARLFQKSDQRYYYVPCPHCKKPQVIKWENIKWIDDNPETAYLTCTHCGKAIEEYHKTWMLEHGQWIKHNPKSKIPGFHLSALYSPLGWYSWAEAVQEYIDAIGDPHKRQVFVNTVLGEVWEEYESTIDAHWLRKRKEKYPAIVPQRARILSAGVDTHDDRLECTVLGHGYRNEIWVIDHTIIFGSPEQETVWELLDQHLLTQWQHESGEMMSPACTLIDAMGHATDEVYAFCKQRMWRRIYPLKGMHGPGKPLITPKKNKRAGTYLMLIGVDQAKNFLYENLRIEKPGPGYIHLPADLPDSYFDQLTAEIKVMHRINGLPVPKWELPNGKRNEALDCFGYALAGFRLLKPNMKLLEKKDMVFASDFSRPVLPRKRRGVRSPGL